MKLTLLISIFGVAGILARYFTVAMTTQYFPNFPVGTLIVNLLGSFLIGFFIQKNNLSPEIKIAVITGLLGGFTTFSSFSYELVSFYQSQQYKQLILYGIGSPILGMAAGLLGLSIKA